MDDKGANEIKNIYIHYLDKWKEIMNSTKIKVENIFDNIINKDFIPHEQFTKLFNFLAEMM